MHNLWDDWYTDLWGGLLFKFWHNLRKWALILIWWPCNQHFPKIRTWDRPFFFSSAFPPQITEFQTFFQWKTLFFFFKQKRLTSVKFMICYHRFRCLFMLLGEHWFLKRKLIMDFLWEVGTESFQCWVMILLELTLLVLEHSEWFTVHVENAVIEVISPWMIVDAWIMESF